MKKYDIIIIDSGIDLSHPFFNDFDFIIDGICLILNEENDELIEYNNFTDELGHGTAVTSIICKYVHNPSILMIKAFQNDFELNDITMIKIFEWIKINTESKIIHMSFGILNTKYKNTLESLCRDLIDQERIIIAAYDNYGGISYPAAFKDVIGVDLSHRCTNQSQLIYIEDSPVNFRAFGISQKLPWINKSYENVCSASFAAPHVTTKILNLIRERILKKDDIINKLKDKCIYSMGAQKTIIPKNAFNIKKAIILPFNKEIHNLLRFNDLLAFSVDGFFDLPYTIKYNTYEFNEIINYMGVHYKLENWNKINWTDDFDTVIVGHLQQLNDITNKDILSKIIEKCINYEKNIFSFDALNIYEDKLNIMNKKGLKNYYPSIDGLFTNKNWLGKMYELNTPVLCVVGTSRSQGKFSLQLSLRKQFLKLDYKVGQLGTEPSSELFGIDYTYPIGFYGEINPVGLDNVANIRFLMNEVENKDCDIIITGTQSQTIPINFNNISGIPNNNYEYILGVCPDIFILQVNVDDDIEYIKKVIKFCESISNGTVIAITISSIIQNSRWSIIGNKHIFASENIVIQKKEEIKNYLNIETFSDKQIQQLTEYIIDYLSEE